MNEKIAMIDRRRFMTWSMITPVILGMVYVAAFFSLKLTRPRWLITHEGPHPLYRSIFYPLRSLTAERPPFCGLTGNGTIHGIFSHGNRYYINFEVNGMSYRLPNHATATVATFTAQEPVEIIFDSELAVDTDLIDSRVCKIVGIRPL